MLTNGDRFPPNVVAAIPPAQADDIQYGLTQVANQPVKKKKKKVANHAAEGSHLHDGTMASRPVVTPFEHIPEPIQYPSPQSQQQPAPKKKKKKKAAATGESSHFPPTDHTDYTEHTTDSEHTDYGSRVDSDSDSNTDRTREKRAQRASGVLQKQPSIVKEDWEGEQNEQVAATQGQNGVASEHVSAQLALSSSPPNIRPLTAANVSRKIGEPTPAPKSSRAQPALADYHAFITAEQSDSSVASSNNLQVQAPQAVRGSSLSPSRSTRFSESPASDLAAGRKHDPLPRSVSPAKSALKHHSPAPSGSPMDPNFVRPRGASATPSETSDISTTEVDALPKRKKSARVVSFDAAPEIVGQSTPGEIVESPSKEKKSWLGLGKSKPTLSTIPSNDDMEELMKPRPQLPSFGSVRGQNALRGNELSSTQRVLSSENRAQYSNDGKAPSSVTSSETSSSSFNNTTPTGVSNDHLVGAILAQEAERSSQQKFVSNEPLPPEVTSVEGGVSFSDSEGTTSDEEEEVAPPVPVSQETVLQEAQVPKLNHVPSSAPATTSPIGLPAQTKVPLLSVSPPTPALEQSKPNDQWQVEVPGGFPVSSDALAQLNESNKASTGTGELAATSNGLGVNIPSDSESDNDSIYSDAAEDPSELDGTGFGSIDAIVDSPVVVAPSSRLATVPESPLARVTEPRLPEADPSWEQTQAHWSSIAEQTKQSPLASSPDSQQPAQQQPPVQVTQMPHAQPIASVQLQQPLQPMQQVGQDIPAPAPRQPRKKKKQARPDSVTTAPVSAAVIAARGVVPESPVRQRNQASAYPSIQQQRIDGSPAAQPFRQSMRTTSPPAPEPTFRQSLRGENRNSMPNPAVNQSKQKRFSQPPPTTVSVVQTQITPKPATQARAALQKKHIPPQVAAAAAVPAQKQRLPPPIVTNDSDSESSFRKARRSKSTSGGKYTMRRSMRGSANTSQPDPRNGVRSVSPVGRRPFSPPASTHTMRASMRASMDNTPTLRGSPDTRRSSSLFGRRQTSQPATASSTGFASKIKSRIVDSDDEDGSPRPTKWRSRFADDSDDEPDFTPVRGIPRRANDSDSTDLEDSSDEEKAPVRAAPKLAVATNNTTAPGLVPQSPTSPQKRGLFGRFRSKKPKEEIPSPVIESPQPAPRQEKSAKASQLGFASTAERDKIIEQTRARLEAAQNAQAAASPPSSSHGKLQRRHIPQRVMSDSWPLPPKIPDHMDNRPGTAESAPVRNGSTRLAEGSMRYHDSPAVSKSGKKKRFPMLRKAFGLKD